MTVRACLLHRLDVWELKACVNHTTILKVLGQAKYGIVKIQYPGEGRRRWQIRSLQEFWTDPNPPADVSHLSSEDEVLYDPDPFDPITKDCPELGILLRTDFTDEHAWRAFLVKLGDTEKDFAKALKEQRASESERAAIDEPADGEDGTEKMDVSDSESDDEDGAPSLVIKVVDPDSPKERALISNISNLSALRLLNDVDIRPAPTLPAQAKRTSPPNPLVDCRGWQEIYSGVGIWIYDNQSNTDQCVRQVSQQGHFYGTATGDSWRARVSHICELQFNMSCFGMKIDFGELDRWDYSERKKNLDEAATPVS